MSDYRTLRTQYEDTRRQAAALARAASLRSRIASTQAAQTNEHRKLALSGRLGREAQREAQRHEV